MSNPYLLETPAVISFSGGRTSGYMLWHILQAFGGTLPDGVKVIFNNTGKERPETLDFVERCSQEWGVDVIWLEYLRDEFKPVVTKGRNGQPSIGRHGYTVVNYATASRGGEPFNQLLEVMEEFRRESKGRDPVLPNVVQRFCTGEMKIRTPGRYLTDCGWSLEEVTDAIGLRADEPNRLAKLHEKASKKTEVWQCGNPVAPLGAAGVSESDVMRFWAEQSFDLGLKQHEGNCDLCFLKSRNKIRHIMRDRPDLAGWWIEAESKTGQRFRKDRPGYRALLNEQDLTDFMEDEADELSIACHCTD